MTGKLSGASKAVRFALVATVLLILALLATPLLPAGWTGAWVVGMIGLLVYVPLTPLALRAQLDNQVLRYFFGLTALPIFAVLFVWVMHRLVTVFPDFGASIISALERPGRHRGMAHAIGIMIPTVAAFAAWFAMVWGLDRALRRARRGAANIAATAFTAILGGGALLLAYDAIRGDRGGSMPSSAWMTGAELNDEFGRWKQSRFYPVNAEGRCEGDGEIYRADWKELRAGQMYYFNFGMPKLLYERYERDVRSHGYAAESVTRFIDCAGRERYSGTWSVMGKP